MEGYMKEGRRVYPTEPRKIMQARFATKYLNYLLHALTNIGKPELSSTLDCCVNKEIDKMVRYEVDMALALSAEGFAWSHALKHRLRLNVNNNNHAGKSQSYLAHHDDHRTKMPVNHEPATKKLKGNPKRSGTEAAVEEEEEERLTYLRKLIPGGSGEMMVDDEILLSELGSYVTCLELQVNVLRSMLQLT
ncbi:hypothetical protein F3Y22_tig00110321pilonHSYRG00036 [Hibiscus syriacus]|uniref:IBH1-like N-terminal domain-containing protein n=1 Tax=Hibiscus syriacus TaxID=106335 RepID=A0A6A3B513_HIBSY|nr:transcription factor bHLH146-like [Hibiscus syriacus]KAE8710362.1 hypothetical protein F3Y22_tig00110321pilonHSYRG00036 [Hibiscus syriacus]